MLTLKKFINKLKKVNPTIFLVSTTILLTISALLGIGFKNSLISAIFIVLFILSLNSSFQFKGKKSSYLMLSFLFLFVLSQFFRQTPYGFHEFINFTLGIILAITISEKAEKIELAKYTKLVSYFLSLVCLVSIPYFIFGPNDRIFGTFIGLESYTTFPNAFADLLIFVTSLQFHQVFQQKTLNKYYLLTLVINLTAFWLTFSRAAYLSLFVSLGFIFIYHAYNSHQSSLLKQHFQKSAKLILIGSISILVAFSINLSAIYKTDISDRVTTQDISSQRSASERPTLWSGAIQITKDYPLFGSGSGSFEFIYPKYQNTLLSNAPHPHNLFLKLSAENGLAVAILFIAILLFAIFPYKLPSSQIGFYGATLAFTIHNLLDYNMNFPIISFIFFLSLGVLFSRFNNLNHQKSKFISSTILISLTIISITSAMQTFGYSEVKKLENSNQPYLSKSSIKLAKVAPFPHQLYSLCRDPFSLQECYIPTETYPNFHPAIYSQVLGLINHSSNSSQQNISNLTNKLLNLNYYNDLNYHLLHVINLPQSSRLDQEENIYKLVQNYISLLEVNTHNTVTSTNPQASYNIIQVFKSTPNSAMDKWENLEKSLQTVYKTESNKFQARFNYPLPDLKDEPIQNLRADT
jgi:O-antigen ligase